MFQLHAERDFDEHIYQICGDMIEITEDLELFVACLECAFPVCRACYEYERREGNQVCPRCKTRYKRFKGELFYLNCSVHVIQVQLPCKLYIWKLENTLQVVLGLWVI